MRRRIVVATMWLLTATLARGAEFVVTTSSDGGPGSLRQAILDANTASGSDTITFGIEPLGGHTIQPSSPLPAIIDAVVIDGTTQPGFAGTPLIEIDGSLAGVPANGLTLLDHDGSTIRSLAINRFQKDDAGSGGRGILIDGGSQHSIVANFLGTDPSGTVDLGNGRYGVALEGCERTTIGGTDVADRNLLSGNDDAGVLIRQGNSNVVWGNYIGTDVSGTSALAGDLGVFILTGVGSPTTNNHVGGALAGQGNVIVANGTGITIGNSPTTGTVVQGNLIGTNAAGTVTLGTMETGVHINSAPDSTIGGTEPNAGNVIGGASDAAVIIRNAAADDNVVQGNIIGTDASGTIPLPNGMGVLVSFAASGSPVGATIGGSGGAGNVITNSSGAGVVVLTGLSTNPGVITSPTAASGSISSRTASPRTMRTTWTRAPTACRTRPCSVPRPRPAA
jgi:hypothetical protein